jgi:hypothetical protein
VNARTLEAEVDEVRNELTALVAELDRRRHELFDVRLQVRRHIWPVALGALVMGATAAGAITLGVRRTRRQQGLTVRGRRIGQAVSRLLDRPERVAVEPTVLERIAVAAGSAAAVYVVKLVLNRVVARR